MCKSPMATRMNDIYIGVDPGKSGAICCVDGDRVGDIITTTDASYSEIWKEFAEYIHESACIACIESVNAMPGQGVSSTFKFGESYGALLMLLSAAKVSFTRVRPASWCSEFGLKRDSSETQSEWKNRHKMLAQELFPDTKITHATADALLIAEYCRRKNK